MFEEIIAQSFLNLMKILNSEMQSLINPKNKTHEEIYIKLLKINAKS